MGGKAGSDVEFGKKIGVSSNGYAAYRHLVLDNYNEGQI